MKGIDVSEFQGKIDWNTVKNNGVEFAIIRLGWIGNNSNKLDKYFERNYEECKKYGIPVGVYVYNYVKTPDRAARCAKWVLEQLENKSLELPVYIDMEDSTIVRLGKDILTNICISFNSEIEDGGFWAGVYANANWYENYLKKDVIKKFYTTWIAHYGVSEDRYAGKYDMLQYTSKGKVNGISGNVDMDIMYRDLIQDIKGATTPKLKSTDEIAKEVIAGKWGNGVERKRRLEEAGYKYSTIQNRVNEILKGHV